MSGSGNTTVGSVLGASTVASAGAVLANTGTSNLWITITASIALGLSIITVALRLATSTKK